MSPLTEASAINDRDMVEMQRAELSALRDKLVHSRAEVDRLHADVEFWRRQLQVERDRVSEFLERLK
jgi:hypothetical protein